MLTRIDLRGRRDADPLAVLPRARLDVGGRGRAGPAGRARTSATAAPPPCARRPQRFDGVDARPTCACPPTALADALEPLDPAVRAALEEAIRRAAARPRGAAARRRRRRGRRRRHRHRALGAGRPRRALRPGRPRRLSEQRRHERRPRAGRGRRLARRRVAAQPEYDGLPHPAVLAACALLGVDEVYAVGGAQAVAMFAYGIEGVPAGRHRHRARQRLRRRRQAPGAGASSASTPRPARPRSASSPTTPPTPAYVAADLVAQAEHDPLAACLLVTDERRPARRRRRRARQAGRRDDGTASGSRPRWPASRRTSLVDDLDHGLEVVDAWAAEHLEVITADAPERARAGPQRRRHLRRRLHAGQPRRLPRRVQPRAADRRHRAAQQRPVGAVVPRGCHVVEYYAEALARGRAARRRARRGRGPGRARRGRAGPAAMTG